MAANNMKPGIAGERKKWRTPASFGSWLKNLVWGPCVGAIIYLCYNLHSEGGAMAGSSEHMCIHTRIISIHMYTYNVYV